MDHRGPITVFADSGNMKLYRTPDSSLYLKYVRSGDGHAIVTIASGGHTIGSYRDGKPVTAVEEHVLRKVLHSNLPVEVKGVINKNALDLTDGPLEGRL